MEIVIHAANGLETAAIAEEMGLSRETVRHHKRNIRRRKARRTMAGCVAEAFRTGQLKPWDIK